MAAEFGKLCAAYLEGLRAEHRSPQATDELSFHHVLHGLLTGAAGHLDIPVHLLHEPRNAPSGRPDFVATSKDLPIGYVEAEAYGINLDALGGHAKEQNERFQANLDNFILTNFLEFRLYVGGSLTESARLMAPPDKAAVRVSAGDASELLRLLTHFFQGRHPDITSPQHLAEHLARRTRQMRDQVRAVLMEEGRGGGDVREHYEAFRQALVPDLRPYLTDEERQSRKRPPAFDDMFAQTITYGLFAAGYASSSGQFTRRSAAGLVPNAWADRGRIRRRQAIRSTPAKPGATGRVP